MNSSSSQENDDRIKQLLQLENQGGDLTGRDYFWYATLGVIFPIMILVWGWF